MDAEFGQFSFGGGDFHLEIEGSSYTEVSNLNLGETGAASTAGTEQKTRKRKIDKDGFVAPATPDVPKSSCHFEESTHNDQQSGLDLGSSFPCENESSSEFCLNGESVTENTETQPSIVNDDQPNSIYFGNSTSSEPASASISANSGSVQELIKELGQEAKLLQMQWAETFKESEDFEMLCQNQLDSYIEGANNLETTLNRQKDVLFRRLQGLGKTLQM